MQLITENDEVPAAKRLPEVQGTQEKGYRMYW